MIYKMISHILLWLTIGLTTRNNTGGMISYALVNSWGRVKNRNLGGWFESSTRAFLQTNLGFVDAKTNP